MKFKSFSILLFYYSLTQKCCLKNTNIWKIVKIWVKLFLFIDRKWINIIIEKKKFDNEMTLIQPCIHTKFVCYNVLNIIFWHKH